MVRHSVIAIRDDDDAGPGAITFSDEAWLEYVPVRDPDALTLTEQLPAGAADQRSDQSAGRAEHAAVRWRLDDGEPSVHERRPAPGHLPVHPALRQRADVRLGQRAVDSGKETSGLRFDDRGNETRGRCIQTALRVSE